MLQHQVFYELYLLGEITAGACLTSPHLDWLLQDLLGNWKLWGSSPSRGVLTFHRDAQSLFSPLGQAQSGLSKPGKPYPPSLEGCLAYFFSDAPNPLMFSPIRYFSYWSISWKIGLSFIFEAFYWVFKKYCILDFPVVKHLPVNAGDTSLIPGSGRSRMPQVTNPVCHNYEPRRPRAPCFAKRSHFNEKPTPQLEESSPHSLQLEKKALLQHSRLCSQRCFKRGR